MLEILELSKTPQYLEQLAEWHQREWAHLNPGESLTNRINEMQLHLNSSFLPTTFVALDEKLLGSAAIVSNDMETHPQLIPWLASVYVLPEHRHKGIGSGLVLHTMNQAKLEGIETVHLFTPDQKTFYQRLGWQTFAEEQYRGEHVTIMSIIL